jgi:hypothetical protein
MVENMDDMSELFRKIIQKIKEQAEAGLDEEKLGEAFLDELLDCENCALKEECDEFNKSLGNELSEDESFESKTSSSEVNIAKMVLMSMPNIDKVSWDSIDDAHAWLSTILQLQEIVRNSGK